MPEGRKSIGFNIIQNRKVYGHRSESASNREWPKHQRVTRGLQGLMENLASNNDAGGDGSSIVPTIAAWLSSTCSASTCSPIIISQASAEVESQCRTDMSQKSYIPLVAYALLSNYETARNVLCSHASTSKRYCMNQIFTEMESASGSTFTTGYFQAILVQPGAFVNSLNGTAWCTKCLNSAVTEGKPIIASVNQQQGVSSVNSLFEKKCKAQYHTGQSPQGVSDATGSKALPFDGAIAGTDVNFELLVSMLAAAMAIGGL
ncbi:MAG: hypothetical protein CYPHOPRED_000947 [Cyphobasidiales sp. Tagirdzhanova-0007]|nr:MAG: hypothetical protein CYPHOPRED_000947 [Cyphobasidiales sp. Tagirdzhanova-0007]